MRIIRLFTALCAVMFLFSGCGAGGEWFGVRKPTPRITGVAVNRNASVITVHVNRNAFEVNEFAAWRLDQYGDKKYLNFAWDRTEAQGDNGVAYFVVAHGYVEALDETSIYYVLVEVEAECWNYDSGHEGETYWRKAAALYECKPGQVPHQIE